MHNDSEGRNAVGGDEQQTAVGYGINVTYFAPFNRAERR
jgi:hypothetical protein